MHSKNALAFFTFTYANKHPLSEIFAEQQPALLLYRTAATTTTGGGVHISCTQIKFDLCIYLSLSEHFAKQQPALLLYRTTATTTTGGGVHISCTQAMCLRPAVQAVYASC